MVAGVSGAGGAKEPKKPEERPKDKTSETTARIFSSMGSDEALRELSTPLLATPGPKASTGTLESRSKIVQESLERTTKTLEVTASAVRDSNLPAEVRGPAEGFLASASRFIEALASRALNATGSLAYGIALAASLLHDAANSIRRLCQLPEHGKTGLTLVAEQFRTSGDRLQEAASRLRAAPDRETLHITLGLIYNLVELLAPSHKDTYP